LNFIGSIDRQYDDSYAKAGAKIGDTLKVRLPNEYTVRSGINMAAQTTSETSVDLVMSTVKGVDLNFTSVELALSLDDFSERIVKPATSKPTRSRCTSRFTTCTTATLRRSRSLRLLTLGRT
jgi:hypothetical protein